MTRCMFCSVHSAGVHKAVRACKTRFMRQANAADQYGGADVAAPHTADHLVRFAVQQESSRLPRYAGPCMLRRSFWLLGHQSESC